jgi:hypothetical protein
MLSQSGTVSKHSDAIIQLEFDEVVPRQNDRLIELWDRNI